MKSSKKEPRPEKKKRILIVDDHPIVRQGLSQMINHDHELAVCGEAGDRAEALEALETLSPDLVLLDLSLKGTDGLQVVKDMRVRQASVRVLVVSMHDELLYAERALRAGARGYIMKQEAPTIMMEAIRRILGGQTYVSARVQEKILAGLTASGSAARTGVEQLSDRELEVLRFLAQGLGNRDIAQKLSLSVKTVETYRENLKLKLNLKSASELVQFAIQWSQGQPR